MAKPRNRLADALAYIEEMRNRLVNQVPVMAPDDYGQRFGAEGERGPSLGQIGQRAAETTRRLTSLDQPQSTDAGDVAVDIAAGFTPLQYPQAGRDYIRADREGDVVGKGLAVLSAAPVVGGLVKLSKAERIAQLLGKSAESTPEAIIEATQKGGYSVNLPTGATPKEGLMMGKYANVDPRNMVLESGQPLTQSQLGEFVKRNEAALGQPENFLGTWSDPESGKTYLDVSRRFEPTEIRKATKFGERTGQLAGYNVGEGASFPVGNWRQFIQSPEFAGRMDEMASIGRDYLSKHMNKEWWDMHGSSFERVYGPENLDKLAGFIASTAPNAQPRENLQTMSEYMRRFIKKEPIIQPDYRIPPGQMSRKEGSKIGMESSRAANLRQSEKGNLAGLQKNKVREEAMALMGDPTAVVLDRHWARIAEDPTRGIFTASSEGIVEAGADYEALKTAVSEAAAAAKRSPRDYSADVWTGIRETIKKKSELFGQKFKGSAIRGESKSYADQFDDLIADKAKFLGISVEEMERRLRNGDATLLSIMLLTPIGTEAYKQYQSEKSGGM
jgi:hypothetical protein